MKTAEKRYEFLEGRDYVGLLSIIVAINQYYYTVNSFSNMFIFSLKYIFFCMRPRSCCHICEISGKWVDPVKTLMRKLMSHCTRWIFESSQYLTGNILHLGRSNMNVLHDLVAKEKKGRFGKSK